MHRKIKSEFIVNSKNSMRVEPANKFENLMAALSNPQFLFHMAYS